MRLSDARVVVTRPREQAGRLIELLEREGADVIALPTIRIEDPDSFDELDAAIEQLTEARYDWVAFTSANAVGRFVERLARTPGGTRLPEGTRIAAVGGATAELLAREGLRPQVVAPQATGVSLARALGTGPGTVVAPRAAEAHPDLVDALGAAGWSVHEVVAYRTVAEPVDEDRAEELRSQGFDAVVFSSPSSARSFFASVGSPRELHATPDSDGGPVVVCIGPVTADAVGDLGARVDAIASRRSDAGLVDALAGAMARRSPGVPSERSSADGTIRR